MGISALMVLCMLVPCINGIDADVEVEQVYVEDKPVTVVGYQTTDEVVKTLNKYSDLVEVSDNISIDNGCYLIGSDAVMHGSIEYGEIEQAVYNGTPVAVVGGGYEVVTAIGKTLGFNATSADMQAYGIRYDPEADVQYVYSVSGFETEAEVARERHEQRCFPVVGTSGVAGLYFLSAFLHSFGQERIHPAVAGRRHCVHPAGRWACCRSWPTVRPGRA